MADSKDKIFVYGASGHAKVVVDIIERQGLYDVAFLVDDNTALQGKEIYGYSVIGGKTELLNHCKTSPLSKGIVAIGDNSIRMRIATWLKSECFALISAIHPGAWLARGVRVGEGTAIMAGAVINSDATIGDSCIVNTKASIDHDCAISDGVHIAPGVTLCGGVSIGSGSFVGAGAVVIPNLAIGRNALVGAGATVVKDVSDGVLVTGTPAKTVSKLP